MADDLQIIAPSRRKHMKAMAELFDESFRSEGGSPIVSFARNRYFGNSIFNWDTSRIGLVDGELATHCGLFDYRIRIGSARVKVAGVGGVMTAKKHRRRGLMADTMNSCTDGMYDAGYDMSILYGIGDFYHRFGYVRAWPARVYYVETSHLPTEYALPKSVRFPPGVMRELDTLYNREKTSLTGTAVRATWDRNPIPAEWRGYYWLGDSGKPSGYLVVQARKDVVRHVDSAGDPVGSLRILGRLARVRKLKEVEFPRLHHNSRMARTLRQGNVRVELRYCTSGRAMVRTVNLQSTLAKMAGELSRRLGGSTMNAWRGKLLVGDSRRKAILSINRSSVDVMDAIGVKGRDFKHSIIGDDEIAQLLIGTAAPDETIEAGGIRLRGDARSLAQAMFPAQAPSLDLWDGF